MPRAAAVDHRIYVVTGPESSGKTTLVDRLQDHFGIPTVPEYARTYLEHLDRPYDFDDLLIIAQAQNALERSAHHRFPTIVCDTDQVTIDIWAMEKYGRTTRIQSQFSSAKHYLLCVPDIPWEEDAQRENPNDRDRLFGLYKEYLIAHDLSYEVLDKEARSQWKPPFIKKSK